MGRDILKSSFENASFSIIFQVLFRLITFILNAFIIRTVGQEVLGIMNVRLTLLESTILFLSKEPLLKACLTGTKSHNWAQVVNQIWLSIPVPAVIGLILTYVWINLLSPTDEKYWPQYILGCYAIALSCVIEQMTQVFVLVAQSFCFVKIKIIIDTLYVVSRTLIFVYIVRANPSQSINSFSIAQVVSAVIMFLLYFGFFAWYIQGLNRFRIEGVHENRAENIYSNMSDFPFTSILHFFPGMLSNKENILNTNLCFLTFGFMKQSILKQVLTEGEKYVMTVSPLLTFSQQSMYDIVNNLGSLAARFIFRPIEDSAYFYFTQMIKRGEPVVKQNQKLVSESAEVLSHLCRVVISIGLLVFVFGQSYSYSFLFIYGGHNLVENTLPVTMLRFHSLAVVLLAINGVTEGFVLATIGSKELDRYNYLMVIFSITFLMIAYLFTYFVGPVGFILANCVNMAVRIGHSIIFTKKKYKDTKYNPLSGLIPGYKFVTGLVMSGIITKLSEVYILEKSMVLHIGIGAACFVFTLIMWALENRQLLKLGYAQYKRKSLTKSD
ncbi:man(5)GlcNAc(2)-PP-dolichol translocation protein RFT1 isoform X2 [Leptinotarsa decemlineata]|uniref:man(5)GlcNAc(2)-PP-dolichol translocation protein RFT1 isoform X2 n=1 Tax=Leptinotarsa decemlineata TaxID=7539 RepID=UPI003D305BA3